MLLTGIVPTNPKLRRCAVSTLAEPTHQKADIRTFLGLGGPASRGGRYARISFFSKERERVLFPTEHEIRELGTLLGENRKGASRFVEIYEFNSHSCVVRVKKDTPEELADQLGAEVGARSVIPLTAGSDFDFYGWKDGVSTFRYKPEMDQWRIGPRDLTSRIFPTAEEIRKLVEEIVPEVSCEVGLPTIGSTNHCMLTFEQAVSARAIDRVTLRLAGLSRPTA